MKILQINTVYGEGSTGRIAKELHDLCNSNGIECLSAFRCVPRGQKKHPDSVEISSPFDSRLHGFLSRFTMFKGCFSYFRTKRFIKMAKAYAPDLIHLHNLHGSYINLPLLFKYIKSENITVVWTLHDCWPFTAICSHFAMAGCDKWKSGCGGCPQKKRLSSCPIDFTKKVWKLKKKWFTGVADITLITPSRWLEGLVKESFLKDYRVKTVHNGIDLSAFRPTPSDFRRKYGIEGKMMILGVSFGWSYGKGLDVFKELSNRLDDEYVIVLVGTDDATDRELPPGIVSIHRTNDMGELAEIYTAADVFVNPTREEVLGLVNIEALACGTPVVTFKAGGSPECVDDTCGAVVDIDDVDGLEAEVLRICKHVPYSEKACTDRARSFDKNKMLEEYLRLYKHEKQTPGKGIS